MIEFLNAKAAGYKITLCWINQELNELRPERPNHSELINRLQLKLNECEALRAQLEIIYRIGQPSLVSRALPIIHDIELWILIITGFYLPALRRENRNDLALKNILLPAASRCGLSWIQDFAVRLDGPLAIVSAITEIPVIFSYPQHSISLQSMAGFYHELGHNVFSKFPTIADHLAASVSEYYSEFRRQAGPLGPNERAERDRAINGSLLYWNSKRLDELFADIFGVFVCGPACYNNCVDIAISIGSNPYDVDFMDEHPPFAARVFVSYDALPSLYRQEPSVMKSDRAWIVCVTSMNRNSVFDFACSSNLLHRLVQTVIAEIGTYLPQTKRYIRPLPNEVNILNNPTNIILEDVLNQGSKILLTKPDSYGDWEKKALDALKSQNAN